MSANKILIVDDEEIIVRLLTMSLRSDGYEVVSAFSGEEGLEVFKKTSPDIVVTDIKMPGMDGLELLKQIKEIDPDREVIIVTGHGDVDSTITALQYGASDFINKPVRDEALAIALERAKTKMSIRQQLEEYTKNLETRVAEATEEIRRRSRFQKLLIHSSNDGIVAFDQEWRVVVCNPEATRIFKSGAGQVLNKQRIDDLYTPDLVTELKEKACKNSHQPAMPWRETSLLLKDGTTIPVRYAVSVLYENDEFVGVVNFFQDLTEIKRLESELLQSERLAAVGQTVSGLAHYVKNILIGLKGGSYVMDVGIKKNNTEKLKNGWQTIQKNINRVADLTQDLLTYAKQREPEVSSCNPNDIVTEVVELVEQAAKDKQIRITSHLSPDIRTVLADPETIHRCLLNLVSNGIDACVEDLDRSKEFTIGIRTFMEDGRVCFEVKDNGCGMDEKTLKNLFSPMFSTKGGKGTGLGLLVTAKLVEEHKGKIDTASTPGKGSVFTIRLPFKKA